MRFAPHLLMSMAFAVAALALGGCYMSETALLDPAMSARVLATGPQTAQEPDRSPRQVEVVALPDGWYEIRSAGDGDEPMRMLFNALPGQADRFAMVIALRDAFAYGVAIRQGERLAFDLTDCNEAAQAEIALRHGAQVEPHACAFTEPAALRAALAELAARPPSQPLAEMPSLPYFQGYRADDSAD